MQRIVNYLVYLLSLFVVLTVSVGMAFSDTKAPFCSVQRDNQTTDTLQDDSVYRAELKVNHGKNIMKINFFDRDGYQVRLINVRSILGVMTMSDGTEREITFRPITSVRYKHISKRFYKTYIAKKPDYIEDEDFSMSVKIPIDGDRYDIALGCEYDPVVKKKDIQESVRM